MHTGVVRGGGSGGGPSPVHPVCALATDSMLIEMFLSVVGVDYAVIRATTPMEERSVTTMGQRSPQYGLLSATRRQLKQAVVHVSMPMPATAAPKQESPSPWGEVSFKTQPDTHSILDDISLVFYNRTAEHENYESSRPTSHV
ncbi:hypothetical protein BO71DRAFT_435841 [Aspergillus ellipticus CBS 707.79]|uniref:Uncharacterized protein n=1 Tax=Aspergillus ellipticus CBS 707.79 TaxID=1448320 RepID=A0A319CT67_9EURO|nr:hypothetical protein BO71DRAFT_435841 [Aspergillus ellipticus CBS 707.79]